MDRMNTLRMQTVQRANGYCTLSRAFSDPRAWAIDLPQQLEGHFSEISDACADLGTECGAILETSQASVATYTELKVAHAKNFLGPFERSVSPYGSSYLDPEKGLNGDVCRAVTDFYRQANVAIDDAKHELPDHLVCELEFMYFLTFKQADEAGQWRSLQHQFWQCHMGQWLPQCADAIARHAQHPFYQQLGRLLVLFTEREARLLQ